MLRKHIPLFEHVAHSVCVSILSIAMLPADRKRDLADALFGDDTQVPPHDGQGMNGGTMIMQMLQFMQQQQEQMRILLETAGLNPPPGLAHPQPKHPRLTSDVVATRVMGVNGGVSANRGDQREGVCGDRATPTTPRHGVHSSPQCGSASLIDPTVPYCPVVRGVPSQTARCIDKAARDFERDIWKWIKACDQLATEKEVVQIMEDAKSKGSVRYPPGTRPFKSPCELTALDEPLELAAASDAIFTVTLPKGCTRREALARVHFETTLMVKQTYMRCHEVTADLAKQKVSKEAFLMKCQAYAADQDATTQEGLGLDDPVSKCHDLVAIRARYENKYREIIERVRRDRAEALKSRREQQEREQKVQNDLLQMRPDVLLREVVQDICDARMKAAAAVPTSAQMDVDGAATCSDLEAKVQKLSTSLASAAPSSKNGIAPGGAGGKPREGAGATDCGKKWWNPRVHLKNWTQPNKQNNNTDKGGTGKSGRNSNNNNRANTKNQRQGSVTGTHGGRKGASSGAWSAAP